jgi:hypothetical protein
MSFRATDLTGPLPCGLVQGKPRLQVCGACVWWGEGGGLRRSIRN